MKVRDYIDPSKFNTPELVSQLGPSHNIVTVCNTIIIRKDGKDYLVKDRNYDEREPEKNRARILNTKFKIISNDILKRIARSNVSPFEIIKIADNLIIVL